MKSIITFLALSTLILSASAQQFTKNNTASNKYIITESKINEVDNTIVDLDRGGFLAFIDLEDADNLHMINSSIDCESFSYGPISKVEYTSEDETTDTFASDIFKFKWHFSNSYDNKSGYATVNLIKIFKPQGTIFTMIIILPTLDVIEYKGYIKDSVNFGRLNTGNAKM